MYTTLTLCSAVVHKHTLFSPHEALLIHQCIKNSNIIYKYMKIQHWDTSRWVLNNNTNTEMEQDEYSTTIPTSRWNKMSTQQQYQHWNTGETENPSCANYFKLNFLTHCFIDECLPNTQHTWVPTKHRSRSPSSDPYVAGWYIQIQLNAFGRINHIFENFWTCQVWYYIYKQEHEHNIRIFLKLEAPV